MSTRKIIFTVPISIGDQNPIPLFLDKAVWLTAQIYWKPKSAKIIKIDLKLTNHKKNIFELCHAKMCVNQTEPNHPDYVIMQVSTRKGCPKSSTKPVIFSSPFDFRQKKELKFFFNVSPGNCLIKPKNYTCELGDGTPESKDGVIIVE